MESPGPRVILKLEESVVNRIAAGEVIGRPANAIKELLENCIDAGATSIKISVKDGGSKLLQITDNGCGIRKEDLAILCERFTTSKIRKFDDLASLKTYGFRGEALASISHVSHLTVTTKTREESVGWRAHYLDGILVPSPGSDSSEPRPTASNEGTSISAEDLFYNIPQRRKGLHSASEEYARILDVVSKYAIHNEGVGISVKKVGSSSADVLTSASASTVETIGSIQGEQVRKELIKIECEESETSGDQVRFKCEGWVTNAHYHARKSSCMIFINHRLVDCAPLKKALEGTYSAVLPKGTFPFIYVSLEIAPEHVDPNVHPTKREVRFVGEDSVIDKVCEALAKTLEGSSGSRTYKVQTVLSGMGGFAQLATSSSRPSASAMSKLPPQKLVRTDPDAQTLDSLLLRQPAHKRKRGEDESEPVEIDSEGEESGKHSTEVSPHGVKIEESDCSLTSIKTLRRRVKERKHAGLEQIVKKHIFVGVVDVSKGCTCWQHDTALYLITHPAFCEELFYQLGLRQFGALPRFRLDPPPSLQALVKLAVEREWDRYRDKVLEAMGLEVATEKICHIVLSRAEMLDEYFSLSFDDNGNVTGLPVLLPGYRPNLEKLPLFFMRLALACDWTDELRCFDTFLQELAFYYVPTSLASAGISSEVDSETTKEVTMQLEYVVFPAMRRYLAPSSDLAPAAMRVATMPELYRVFERC